jgi:hypothetical protein
MSLQLSEKFSLPKEAVLWTFAFLAIRGAGKTYDAAKLAEQILKQGYPIVVFDPMGIWWGLRVGINGHEGFPILIIGGQHQDIPIPLQAAKKGFSIVDENKLREMVNAILQAGLSVIVDTSNLSSRTQQTRTVAFFADELFKRNARYGIRHVFIEEADVYVPQRPLGETQASHTAIDNLVRRGGNFNLGCTMISQRSAVIDKDVLSQANCLVVLRVLYVRDKDAIREWVKNAVKNEAEMKKLAKWYDSLKKLKNGEAWLYSPEHNDLFEKIQFGERETLHASREYFLKETWEQKNITLRDVTLFVKAYKAKIEPKPTVQPIKPSVTSVITAKDSGYSVIKREEPQKTTVGEAVGKTVAEPTVQQWKTVGETPSQIHNPQSALDKMEMRIPDQQEAQVQIPLPSSGTITSPSRTQYGPALEQAPDSVVQQSLPTIEIHQTRPILRLPVESLNEPTTALGRLAVVIVNREGSNPTRWTRKGLKDALVAHSWPTDGADEAIDQLIRWEILRLDKASYLWARRERIKTVETSPILGIQ